MTPGTIRGLLGGTPTDFELFFMHISLLHKIPAGRETSSPIIFPTDLSIIPVHHIWWSELSFTFAPADHTPGNPLRGLRLTADDPPVGAHHCSDSVPSKLGLTIFPVVCHPENTKRQRTDDM